MLKINFSTKMSLCITNNHWLDKDILVKSALDAKGGVRVNILFSHPLHHVPILTLHMNQWERETISRSTCP